MNRSRKPSDSTCRRAFKKACRRSFNRSSFSTVRQKRFVRLRSTISLSTASLAPVQIQIIDSLLHSYYDNLTKCGTFEPSTGTRRRSLVERVSRTLPCLSGTDNSEIEPATSLLWLQYFLAQHYDHLGDTEKAFEQIEQAICDTPTLVELYMFKAKIFKV